MSIYCPGSQYASIEAYYALPLRRFAMEAHSHSRCEIMCVISGECLVEADAAPYKLGAGDFVFIDADVPHRLLVEDAPCALLNLEFAVLPAAPGFCMDDFMEGCAGYQTFLTGAHRVLRLHDSHRLGYALKDLIAELERAGEPDPYLRQLLFFRLLAELVRCVSSSPRYSGLVHLRRAEQFIAEHLTEDIDVAAVAGHAGINHTYLQTLFSRQHHMGIMAYVNARRMEYASFMLGNSATGITDLAYTLGYNSRQHFGYTFKKHFGMSPRQYRAMKGCAAPADTGGCQVVGDGRLPL